MSYPHPEKTWTVAEAKARLSEILRLASEEGPQQIGTKNTCVVVPADAWRALTQPETKRMPLGRWLTSTITSGDGIPVPERGEPERFIPFQEEN